MRPRLLDRVTSVAVKEARAATYEASASYTTGGVRALLDAAQLRYGRMRKGQRGRPAQAARVAALKQRLREMSR